MNDNKLTPNIEICNAYVSCKCLNQNDGVFIYVKRNIKYQVTEPEPLGINILTVNIEPNILMLATYRLLSEHCIDNFLNAIENIIRPRSSIRNVILVGDIDVDIEYNDWYGNSASYLHLSSELGMLPGHRSCTRL